MAGGGVGGIERKELLSSFCVPALWALLGVLAQLIPSPHLLSWETQEPRQSSADVIEIQGSRWQLQFWANGLTGKLWQPEPWARIPSLPLMTLDKTCQQGAKTTDKEWGTDRGYSVKGGTMKFGHQDAWYFNAVFLKIKMNAKKKRPLTKQNIRIFNFTNKWRQDPTLCMPHPNPDHISWLYFKHLVLGLSWIYFCVILDLSPWWFEFFGAAFKFCG